MDLHLVAYNHDEHFPIFWSIFNEFWEGINGVSLKGCHVVQVSDGRYKAISQIEATVLGCINAGWKTKFAYCTKLAKILGFIQYEFFSNGVLFIHSAYVLPEFRDSSVGGFMMRSFKKGTPIQFQIHKDNPPSELLSCTRTMERVCDSLVDSKLELWQGEVA